jgi:hypothetical protein
MPHLHLATDVRLADMRAGNRIARAYRCAGSLSPGVVPRAFQRQVRARRRRGQQEVMVVLLAEDVPLPGYAALPFRGARLDPAPHGRRQRRALARRLATGSSRSPL